MRSAKADVRSDEIPVWPYLRPGSPVYDDMDEARLFHRPHKSPKAFIHHAWRLS